MGRAETIERLKRRTAERVAAGLAQPPPPASAAPRVPLKLLPACPLLGEKIPGRPCGSTLHVCGLDRSNCSRYTPCTGAARVCQTCTVRPDLAAATESTEPRRE